MSLRSEMAMDMQKSEIQDDLMHPIKVDGQPMNAVVGNSMLTASYELGGLEYSAQERFRIPRTEFRAGFTMVKSGSVIEWNGRTYLVEDIDPDIRSPFISCVANLFDE
jgi:hypothetical protein